MSLNIKNERVHALVREAAARTGLSQTSVVEEALRRMLKELNEQDQGEWEVRRNALEIAVAEFHALSTPETKALLTTDDLYDEEGMPA